MEVDAEGLRWGDNAVGEFLPHKHEDLSLDPQRSQKSQCLQFQCWERGQQRLADAWSSPVSQPQ